ncbi:unnamed protein product [Strongylus vulgaris]|uniref:Uncharacterized protein n=1 Tax=Strongylus vulgaris TaxID=40348 RepID=A0A3P7IW96_STRVU|nr:unnamed protein product [Strongylus vulgaris]
MKIAVLVLVSSLHTFAFNLDRNHIRRAVAEKQSGYPQKHDVKVVKRNNPNDNLGEEDEDYYTDDEEGLFIKDADNEYVDEKKKQKSKTKSEAGSQIYNHYAHVNVDIDDEASKNILQSLLRSVLGVREKAVLVYAPDIPPVDRIKEERGRSKFLADYKGEVSGF